MSNSDEGAQGWMLPPLQLDSDFSEWTASDSSPLGWTPLIATSDFDYHSQGNIFRPPQLARTDPSALRAELDSLREELAQLRRDVRAARAHAGDLLHKLQRTTLCFVLARSGRCALESCPHAHEPAAFWNPGPGWRVRLAGGREELVWKKSGECFWRDEALARISTPVGVRR